jgi:hypothetical protein
MTHRTQTCPEARKSVIRKGDNTNIPAHISEAFNIQTHITKSKT